MTSHDTDSLHVPTPGRPIVLEPLAPGLWTMITGAVVAVLAPLFGFLVGTMLGPGDGRADLNPIQVGLIIGIILGGLGVALALWGGMRVFHHSRAATARPEQADPIG